MRVVYPGKWADGARASYMISKEGKHDRNEQGDLSIRSDAASNVSA